MKTITICLSLIFISFLVRPQEVEISLKKELQYQENIESLSRNSNNKRIIRKIEKFLTDLSKSFDTQRVENRFSDNQLYWDNVLSSFINISNMLSQAKTVLNDNEIIKQIEQKNLETKQWLSDSVYLYAKNLIKTESRENFIKANELLLKLNSISPSYKNIDELINETQKLGTLKICLSVINNSDSILNDQILYSLTDIDSLNSISKWINYSYSNSANSIIIKISINQIDISPENFDKKSYKEIKNEYQYKYYNYEDNNYYNSLHKDRLSNPKRISNKYSCRVTKYSIDKSIELVGNIEYKFPERDKNVIDRPFHIKNCFNYSWAEYIGDKKALKPKDVILVNNAPGVFPSYEELVHDVFKQFRNVLIQEKVFEIF